MVSEQLAVALFTQYAIKLFCYAHDCRTTIASKQKERVKDMAILLAKSNLFFVTQGHTL
jgi:hypothetical protein